MLKQKRMIAEHFSRLARAPQTGEKNVYTFVPGNLTELIGAQRKRFASGCGCAVSTRMMARPRRLGAIRCRQSQRITQQAFKRSRF